MQNEPSPSPPPYLYTNLYNSIFFHRSTPSPHPHSCSLPARLALQLSWMIGTCWWRCHPLRPSLPSCWLERWIGSGPGLPPRISRQIQTCNKIRCGRKLAIRLGNLNFIEILLWEIENYSNACICRDKVTISPLWEHRKVFSSN